MMGRRCHRCTDGEGYCGIWPFQTGPDDPFNSACKLHDADFDAHHAGTSDKTRAEVDGDFLLRMMAIATREPEKRKRTKLIKRAWGYYRIVRGPLGWMAWQGLLQWLP